MDYSSMSTDDLIKQMGPVAAKAAPDYSSMSTDDLIKQMGGGSTNTTAPQPAAPPLTKATQSDTGGGWFGHPQPPSGPSFFERSGVEKPAEGTFEKSAPVGFLKGLLSTFTDTGNPMSPAGIGSNFLNRNPLNIGGMSGPAGSLALVGLLGAGGISMLARSYPAVAAGLGIGGVVNAAQGHSATDSPARTARSIGEAVGPAMLAGSGIHSSVTGAQPPSVAQQVNDMGTGIADFIDKPWSKMLSDVFRPAPPPEPPPAPPGYPEPAPELPPTRLELREAPNGPGGPRAGAGDTAPKTIEDLVQETTGAPPPREPVRILAPTLAELREEAAGPRAGANDSAPLASRDIQGPPTKISLDTQSPQPFTQRPPIPGSMQNIEPGIPEPPPPVEHPPPPSRVRIDLTKDGPPQQTAPIPQPPPPRSPVDPQRRNGVYFGPGLGNPAPPPEPLAPAEPIGHGGPIQQPPAPPMAPGLQAEWQAAGKQIAKGTGVSGRPLRQDDSLAGIIGNLARVGEVRSGRTFGARVPIQLALSRSGLTPEGVQPGISLQDLPQGGGESLTEKAPMLNGEQFPQRLWSWIRANPNWGGPNGPKYPQDIIDWMRANPNWGAPQK